MPRISAETVAEHVAQQEAAVVRAAARLFGERGLSEVSLAEIAAEVGLARNSLYRYFPDKSQIFAAWFRSELDPLQRESELIAAGDAPADDRLSRWLVLHLDYLVAPEHRSMIAAVADGGQLSDDARRAIGGGHEELYATLTRIVSDMDVPRDDELVTAFVIGLLRSAAELVNGGADRDAVGAELLRLARAACT